jgi:HAD superfamily hydrolase (TIGR01509 family)
MPKVSVNHQSFAGTASIDSHLQITDLLFDCDNTLVLSEALAFKACANLANTILEKQGISDRYTGDQLIKDFVGQNFRGMMVSIQEKYNFALPEDELDHYVGQEMNEVIKNLEAEAEECEGATAELEKLVGKYRMTVVSSSAKPRVIASVKKVGHDKYFPDGLIFSAATSLERPTTKPDPAIYLHAMKVIGAKPENSLAVEDSKSGATSAIRAKIQTVAYVGAYPEEEQEEKANMLMDLGCVALMRKWPEFPGILKKIEAA